MTENIREPDGYPEGGIIVETNLETLRQGVKKVLFEFDEFVLTKDNCERDFDGTIAEGESIVFRERIDLLPTEIIAVYLGGNAWYLFCTSEQPETGFPTARDAMKVAKAEERKMRILKKFLTDTKEAQIQSISEWIPNKRVDASQVLAIIKGVTQRFLRCDE